MPTPYRHTTLNPPASFEWPAAVVIARWAIALRVLALLWSLCAAALPGYSHTTVALELGACAALALASWRLHRAATVRSSRWWAAFSAVFAAGCVVAWQPLAGPYYDGFGPTILRGPQATADLLELATAWRVGSWLSPLMVWVAIRLEPAVLSRSGAASSTVEREAPSLAAQSAGLRAVSAGTVGIVLSMVFSIAIAIFFEMRGAEWNTSAFIRGTGMILAGLFAARTLRSLGRLQRWAPSVPALSGGLALWGCAVVGWLFVLRQWMRVLLTLDGRAHVREAFAVQGVIATTTLAAIAMVLWASSSLAERAAAARHRGISWVAAVMLASTVAMMARVHQTIPDFVMRTPAEHRLVALALVTAVTAIVFASLYARRVADALDAKSSAEMKLSD